MIQIPSHIKSLPRFSPAKSTKENALPAINLSSNENPSSVFHELIGKELLDDQHINRYPDPNCTEIRELLAKDVNGTLENVIVGNGSEGILSYIFKAFCPAGTEILTANGTFAGVYILAQSFNIQCIRTPLTQGFGFDLNALLSVISTNSNISVIYLSNPNNPTGSFIPRHQLVDFLAKVPKHIVVILDEAYYEYAKLISAEYDHFDYLGYRNLITLRTFSKAYGLANIRFGYGFASPEIIETLLKVKLTFEPSGIAQKIALVAKKNSHLISQSIQMAVGNLPMFYRFFDSLNISYAKSSANFIMIDLLSPELALAIYSSLIESNIRVSLLVPFGLPHCLRITLGSSEENNAFLNTFKTAFLQSKRKLETKHVLETSEELA